MRFKANGIGLNIEDRGSGPSVLLLHGFTGSRETWAPSDRWWPGFRLIAVDLPGHGESDSPPDLIHYSLHSTLAGLHELVEQLHLDHDQRQ